MANDETNQEYSKEVNEFIQSIPKVEMPNRLFNQTCKWTFRHCGYIFGQPTGYMGTECGRSWSELVDYKKLTFCPFCGKKIEANDASRRPNDI